MACRRSSVQVRSAPLLIRSTERLNYGIPVPVHPSIGRRTASRLELPERGSGATGKQSRGEESPEGIPFRRPVCSRPPWSGSCGQSWPPTEQRFESMPTRENPQSSAGQVHPRHKMRRSIRPRRIALIRTMTRSRLVCRRFAARREEARSGAAWRNGPYWTRTSDLLCVIQAR